MTEKRIKEVEDFVRETIEEEDLQLVLSEIGVTPDWSAAYTPNAGPMDAVRQDPARPASGTTRPRSTSTSCGRPSHSDPKFNDLEFAFDAGGMVRSAMNEGKSTPISIRVTGKNQETAHKIATAIKNEVGKIDGVVDAAGHPAARLSPVRASRSTGSRPPTSGLTQADVMQNVVAAFNSSISVQQAQLLDRPQDQEPVLRGRPVLGEGHQVDRDAAGHPGHDPAPGRAQAADPAAQRRDAHARDRCRPRSRTTRSSRRSS